MAQIEIVGSAAATLREQPELQFDLAQAVYGIGRVAEAERALMEGSRHAFLHQASQCRGEFS